MIPEVEKSLAYLSNRLIAKGTERCTDLYELSNYGMTSMLIEFLIKELANGVDHRYTDIREMQGIFRRCREHFARHFADLQAPLEELAAATPEDFTLKGTNRLHDRCTRQLMELHERVEQGVRAGHRELVQLDGAIWEYLDRMAERHRLS